MSIETEPQLVGSVTGGYRVLARIGTGTMGHVFEAEDVGSGRHVALKVLRKSHQKDLAARFLREGKTLALLSHPHIVQLVDMGQLDDGTLFLATELVGGGSLREVMDRGALEPRRALAMMRQVLDALDAAHGFGVVHRDIKPENVMVAAGDEIKVLDFGVAKLLADTVAGLGEANLTSVGFSIFGSALYIAPESVTGQPVDARLDLYSAGAVLFEMLAGRPPFNDDDPSVLLRQHAFEPAPTLHQVAPTRTFAPELEALVARALAKQPADRYSSAAAMVEALDAALRALDPPPRIAARDLAPDARAKTAVVRLSSRRKLALGAGAVALVLAGVAGFAVSQQSAPAAAVPGSTATPHASTAQALTDVQLGHDQLAVGRHQSAVAAYERALRAAPSLGTNAALRAGLVKVLDGKDVLASILALDLLASLSPPAHDTITRYAATGKLLDARRRALMLAERDGYADKVDRVQSWALDLQQLAACDERKAVVAELARSADRRALAALKRVRTVKCLEREASDAIARIEVSAR